MRFLNEPCRARAVQTVVGVVAVVLVCGVVLPTAQAQTGLLNDTGQTSCYNASHTAVACNEATTGNAGTRPHQDGRYGRDAAQAANVLSTKTGAGAAGFDFTKIANNGTALAAGAALGTNPTDWACTRDNVTGLVWEVKTTSGLRSNAHTYTWYATTNNGGDAGHVGSNTCGGTLSAAPYNNQCNTANYVAAVNAAGLCGATDWRLPTRREVLGIVHNGLSTGPMVDATYLPNTHGGGYWASDTYEPNPAFAWLIHFGNGSTYAFLKTYDLFVRLVRSGQ
ncbi:MAG: hypothetical protein C0445_13515 [Polaromonas sp.]|nr:hypothetical protein [Polaromonas sp.]